MHPGRASAGPSSLLQRLEPKDPYRCLACNASFWRLSVLRSLALSLLFIVLLGGLSYALIRLVGGPRGSAASPRIKNGEIPPPPPPVFR